MGFWGMLNFTCGNKNVIQGLGTLCKRDNAHITYYVNPNFYVGGIDAKLCSSLMSRALNEWASVCGISYSETNNPLASLVVQSTSIDGPNGIASTCQMPCGGVPDSLPMLLNVDSTDSAINPSNLLLILIHEIGHGIGLNHCPQGQGIMAPVLDFKFSKPDNSDLVEARKRYGWAIPISKSKSRVAVLFEDGSRYVIFGDASPVPQTKPGKSLIEITLPNGKRYRCLGKIEEVL